MTLILQICDLLIIEPILLPGTIVIFDGMTNNAKI